MRQRQGTEAAFQLPENAHDGVFAQVQEYVGASPTVFAFRSAKSSALWLEVETEQQFLISNVQSAVRDDWVCPQAAALSPLFRFARQAKAAQFVPAFFRRFDQGH